MEEHETGGVVAGGQQQGTAQSPLGDVVTGEGDDRANLDDRRSPAEGDRFTGAWKAEVGGEDAQFGAQEGGPLLWIEAHGCLRRRRGVRGGEVVQAWRRLP